jgi:hypothetical protein
LALVIRSFVQSDLFLEVDMLDPADSLFTAGATYLVRHDAIADRDRFIEGERLLYWRHAYSRYDDMHGWFFFDESGRVRSWDESDVSERARDDLFALSENPSALQVACGRGDIAAARAAIAESMPGFGMRRIAFEAACEAKAADCAGLMAVLPDVGDEERRDFLHEASRRGFTAGLRALLDAGVDVNATDEYGQTALLWAAVRGAVDCVDLLLSRGADRALRTRAGKTAEDHASALKNDAVVERLRFTS